VIKNRKQPTGCFSIFGVLKLPKMTQIPTKCSKCVDEKNTMVKNGKTSYGKQRYICKNCKTTKVKNYKSKAYNPTINEQIIRLTKEGLGIRSTARVLEISSTTLLKRITLIAENIKTPMIPIGKEYEVDELCTYVGNKERRIWLVCAMEKQSRQVLNFIIGRRTNQTLRKVTESLHLSNAKNVFTDRLQNYKSLIEKKIHKVIRYGTNHLERFHLTLRTHLKRLNRRTICFSKSLAILTAVLKIYLWG